MQKITVISMGKLKEKFFVSAEAEYIKRLGRFCEVKIIEAEPQKLPDNPNPFIKAQLSFQKQTYCSIFKFFSKTQENQPE